MTNEELILQRLDALDAKIDPIIKARHKWDELRDDLLPLQQHAADLMIEHLQEVEAGFQLEDLLLLIKQSMRSIKQLHYALKTLDRGIEFINDIEPLLKSAVPKMIEHLDDLERKGVFRIIKAMLDVRAKVAAEYDHHDIEQISDGAVAMLRLAKKMSDPKVLAFMEKAVALPGHIDLSNTQKIGPFKMISAGFNSEVKDGLGVLMELTKAMGKLKDNGNSNPISARPVKAGDA